MARRRKIDTEEVLDAAERVILRDGATGLSIDAVAKEAGISKSRVVYDYKSKCGILGAMVERTIRAEKAVVEQSLDSFRDSPNPELFARIAAAAQKNRNEDEQAVVLAICAASSNEEAFQKLMREWVGSDLAAVTAGSNRPEASLMAFLALHGFLTIEHFNLCRWSDEERMEILQGIRTIFNSYPEPDPKPK